MWNIKQRYKKKKKTKTGSEPGKKKNTEHDIMTSLR